MTQRLLAALLLLALAAPLSANDAPTLTKSYTFRVAVDDQGKVTEAAAVTEVPAPLVATLTELVAASEFEPAQVDGRPVPSRTSVHVVVRYEGGSDQVRAVPVEIRAGGRLDNSAPPRYPFAQLRGDVGAEVWATLSFHADGRLDAEASRIDSVDVLRRSRNARNDSHKASFESAVKEAMAKWTLVPDEVDGQPIAMTVRVPTRFCPMNRNPRGCDDLWPKRDVSDPVPAPSDADVRLATLKPAAPLADGG